MSSDQKLFIEKKLKKTKMKKKRKLNASEIRWHNPTFLKKDDLLIVAILQ